MTTIPRWITVIMLNLSMVFSFVSCSRDPQSNSSMKQYSNHYFSIRYPQDWKVSDQQNQLSFTGPEELGYYVNVKVDYNPEVDLPLKDFQQTVESQNNLSTLPQFKDMGLVDTSINDQPAIEHSILTAIMMENIPLYLSVRLTYLVKDKLGVVITAEIPQDVLGKYDKQITSMIQSIQLH